MVFLSLYPMNTDFKEKSAKTLKYLGKKLLRGLIYLFRFYLKIKEKLAFGQSLFVLIVLFLIVSISWEVKTISSSSFKESLLSKITASEAVIVVTPESEPATSADRPDFSMAIAKSDPPESEDIPLSLGASSLITPNIEFEGSEPLTRTETEKYIVQPGDTISSIAEKFGIDISSILWENNLTLRSVLQPGREITILPVSGLTHKVSRGETLEQIAKKYKANIDEIVDFNGLADADDLQVGDALMIPYGQKPTPPPAPKPIIVKSLQENVELVKTSPNYFSWLKKTACHRFAYGHCTSWVAFKLASSIGKCIPWTGNAKAWIGNAKKAGFAVGSEPQVGAIISLRDPSWVGRLWGHVAYVESFDANTVTFSEMNHLGLYKVSRRTLPLNSSDIVGYIYP